MTKKKPPKKKNTKKQRAVRDPSQTQAALADRHVLYERAVQCVEAEIDMVDETFENLRGRKAMTLREDFCGTANTSCEWVRRRKDNRAWGVDLDAEVLEWGQTHRIKPLKPHQRNRVEIVLGDVLTAKTPRVDAILAMNFSYWIFSTREQMKAYFSQVRSCLNSDGVFFMDAYGGAESMTEMEEETDHGDFTYVWDQAKY
ncbi:MAG: class I SAM-dependent methyltransferase, partial [Gammaproteobacteria bacterium]